MAKPTPSLHKVEVEKHLRRLTSGVDGPVGIQWFGDVRFAEPGWFRDRARVAAVVDALAATKWFSELDVFAPGHRTGTPFASSDEVRDQIANGEEVTAILAHGEPRMTVDIQDADAAVALDVILGRLELRAWFGVRVVQQYKGAVLGDIAAMLVALRQSWPDAFIAKASATPDPADGLRYRRTRPLRIVGRALSSVVDILDRDVPPDGFGWVHETAAMVDAPVPPCVDRSESGRIVVLRWVDDPSDWRAMQDACSLHEQWLVWLIPGGLAPGWNEEGDVEVVDDPKLREVASDDAADWGKPTAGSRPIALLAKTRAHALAILERAKAAGFERVLYRDGAGTLWDPSPPGDWVTSRCPSASH